jgi:flagellar biosynthesis/type III secretory pathway chaperone
METGITEQQMLALLEQQLGCYRNLAKLAMVQHSHVQDSRTEDLLKVLGQRQELLDQLADLEQLIGPIRKQWNDFMSGLTDDNRAEAERMVGQSRKFLEEITTSDRNDALVLQQRKLNLGRDINQATAARKFNRNYAVAAYGSKPSTLDIQR